MSNVIMRANHKMKQSEYITIAYKGVSRQYSLLNSLYCDMRPWSKVKVQIKQKNSAKSQSVTTTISYTKVTAYRNTITCELLSYFDYKEESNA